MLLLIVGVILWVGGHLWNRFLPNLYARLGTSARGLSAVVIVISVVCMVIGYRSAEFILLWTTASWMIHVNNLLMVVALFVFFSTAVPRGTAWIVGNVKNPQLTGFKIWAVAHLLVNGDVASVILFGGLLVWAVVEVILIKKQGERFDRSKAPLKSPWAHLVLVAVALVVVSGAHIALGVNPFGG